MLQATATDFFNLSFYKAHISVKICYFIGKLRQQKLIKASLRIFISAPSALVG